LSKQHTIPVVLAISGSDPSGGAGAQADIETLASMGCHAAAVITALTVQDTRCVRSYESVNPALVRQQLDVLFSDLSISACKIGMIGSAGIAAAVREKLVEHPDIPVVLDPVLAGGGGGDLSDEEATTAMMELLLPLANVVTPNSLEVRRLVPEKDSLTECARGLMAKGAEFVLVTGTHEDTPAVVNALYGQNRLIERYSWERLPGVFHGSGCTLASAIAGLLAHGAEPRNAIREAQEYTWETLKRAYRIGRGQSIPNRLYWTKGHTT
jgi:hydroxymethylpyrimidine/phosphomethylpyrimidine kinase